MKYLVQKTTRNGEPDNDEFQRGLLEWRNTPGKSGFSPAQQLFGRPLTSFVIAHRRSFAPTWQQTATALDRARRPDTSTPHTQRSPRSLSTLSIGTHVDIQDPRTKRCTKHGVIVAIGSHRDYFVKLPSGRVYWRNRRFLRPYRPLVPTPPEMSVAQSGPTSQLPAPVPRRSSRTRRAPDRLNVHSTSGQSYI